MLAHKLTVDCDTLDEEDWGYRAECSCGWIGQWNASQEWATNEWAQHVEDTAGDK